MIVIVIVVIVTYESNVNYGLFIEKIKALTVYEKWYDSSYRRAIMGKILKLLVSAKNIKFANNIANS